MNMLTKTGAAFLSVLLLTATASAQGLFEAAHEGPRDCTSHIAKFLYRDLSFTAVAQVTREYKHGAKPDSFQARIAVLEGKVRSELRSDDKNEQELPQEMGNWGVLNSELIYRPDKGVTIIVMPGVRSYYELPDFQLAAPETLPVAFHQKEVGVEEVDGHPCKKIEVRLADKTGDICKGIAWLANDLGNLPVRIQVLGEAVTVTVSLRDIKSAKPPMAQFEPPKEYRRYNSFDELIADQMKQP